MIVVIIAGGSGTRLWPLSTPKYPKHLLVINGHTKSLLQHTYRRASRLTKSIYVVSEKGHVAYVKEQLPDLPPDAFIIESDRRGTASCIIAALHHISARHKADEPIAFLAADHYVRDTEGFLQSFRVAAKVSASSKRIVLIGVEPDYPSTGMGYIEKGDACSDESFVFGVKSFKEKPVYEVAQEYVKSGKYLWNCGYFVGSIETFLAAMKQYAPKLLAEYEQLQHAKDANEYQAAYLSFENTSIDYALMEHTRDLLVLPASFDWMDLGSFGDLHKAVESDNAGNHIKGKVELEGVDNSFIENHDEEKPLAVVGMDNVVVINGKHGLLVARKDLAQKIGEVSKRFGSQ